MHIRLRSLVDPKKGVRQPICKSIKSSRNQVKTFSVRCAREKYDGKVEKAAQMIQSGQMCVCVCTLWGNHMLKTFYLAHYLTVLCVTGGRANNE
jgi:hypothetical protein